MDTNKLEQRAVNEILKEVNKFMSDGVSVPVRMINDCMVDLVTPEKISLKDYQEDYIVVRASVLCDIASFLVDIYERYKMIDSKFFRGLD